MSILSLIVVSHNNPELITLKSFKRLLNADVVIYDEDINPGFFNYMKEEAIKIEIQVNKGKYSFTARTLINDSLKKKKKIARLTTRELGNLYELDWVKEAKVSIEIIPELKSYLSIPATKKVAITQRGLNTSFIVIKEKIETGKLFKKLELVMRTDATLVISKNIEKLTEIVEFFRFYEKGDMPIAIALNPLKADYQWKLGSISTIENIVPPSAYNGDSLVLLGAALNVDKDQKNQQITADLLNIF